MLLEQLDAFWQYGFTVHTLESVEAGLQVGDMQFVRTAHGSATAVGNPVVLEVTESNGICTCRDGRSILGDIS